MKKVYRLGPPRPPTFHRDRVKKLAKKVFDEGGFYAVGRRHLAERWRTMSSCFAFRPLYEITLCDDAEVIFYSGFGRQEKIATDLKEITLTDFSLNLGLDYTEGLVIDPEECQLIVRMSDIVSVKEIDRGDHRTPIYKFTRRTK